ncbi:MAG: CoA transferase [Actinomycetota bacterium]
MNEPSTNPSTEGAGPLAGVRVVELGVFVAGPAAAGTLAEWGADVIKVEPPSGDPQRRVFGAMGVRDDIPVPPFEVDNRGKRSVVLDLRDESDRAALDRLLDSADVFVTNMRMGALERLGLDHDTLCAARPSLVYGLITGYGHDGEERDRAGYDVGAYWARSGFAHTMVAPGALPPAPRSGMGDHQTGLTLAGAISAKLFERERTGRGGFVTTSLLRVGMYSVSWDMGIHLRFGKRQQTADRFHDGAPLVNCYRSGDEQGFWLICLEADRHWPKVLAALDDPPIGDDERFATARGRRHESAALVAALDAEFERFTMDELVARFDQHDVWWAPIQSIPDVIADPQAQAGFVDMVPREGEEPYRAVAGPVDFGGHRRIVGPVPRLGEHTDQVLGEL